MLFVGESWKRTIVRSVQPLSPLLWFVSAIGQEQQLCLHQCSSRLGMGLKLILLRTITKSGKRSLMIWSSFKRLFLVCWQFITSLSHLYIKEWRLRELWETQQQFTSAKTLLKLFCIKSSLRISYQSSYLRNSRVLRVCIWFTLWTPLIVYQVFKLKQIFCNSVWIKVSCLCAWVIWSL